MPLLFKTMKKKYFFIISCGLPLMAIAVLLVFNLLDSGKLKYQNISKHGEDISILVAFGTSSAERRFVVYDNKRNEIIGASKCAHGSGGGSTAYKPVFSNTPGSQCSSLGEYRLTNVSTLYNCGMRCIRLQGLSKSNSNAASRGITIHEAPFFADGISVGIPIPVSPVISQGCFAISTKVFETLIEQIKENKTIYLYATEKSL